MVNCRTSCIACCKKSKPVVLCRSSRSGRVTCSRITRPSQPLRISIFLLGLECMLRWKKKTSQYLKKEFRSSARRFLEDFTSTVLATVAARSKLGQGVSCFCPEVIVGGDDHSAFFLFGQLLDGLVES